MPPQSCRRTSLSTKLLAVTDLVLVKELASRLQEMPAQKSSNERALSSKSATNVVSIPWRASTEHRWSQRQRQRRTSAPALKASAKSLSCWPPHRPHCTAIIQAPRTEMQTWSYCLQMDSKLLSKSGGSVVEQLHLIVNCHVLRRDEEKMKNPACYECRFSAG